MPSLPLTALNQTVAVGAGDLVSSAFRDIGVGSAGEALQAEDSDWGLENLQRRIDLVNAQRRLIYAVDFHVFTTPANTQPITIGPGSQFVLPEVPIRIESANWILPGTNGDIDLQPMQILSDQEWSEVTIKNLKSTLPTALYYSRGATQGNIYLLPIPSQGNQIRLQLWTGISQALALGTKIGMPPAYWTFLMCAIAADAAPSYGDEAMQRVASPAFQAKYREARNAIQDNNNDVPRMKSGVPSGGKGRVIPDFNWLTGKRG